MGEMVNFSSNKIIRFVIKFGILTKIHPIFQRVRGSTFAD